MSGPPKKTEGFLRMCKKCGRVYETDHKYSQLCYKCGGK